MKSQWESRVGMLLDPAKRDEFRYSYKPVDGLHGGQPKIDWMACDQMGRFWLIEVKWLPETRRSINLFTDVTAGQRQGLAAVALSDEGVALLAIGQGKLLRIYSYREVMLWMTDNWSMVDPNSPNLLLPVNDETARPIRLPWSGPKHWDHSLFDLVHEHSQPTAPTNLRLVTPSQRPEQLASISKLPVSTRIVPLMRPLEP